MKLWYESAEKYFHKSLDTRSFQFKGFEKKAQTAKKLMEEIKNIIKTPLYKKNKNQFKGGSREAEFYCTYTLFESLCVLSHD